MMTLNMKKLAAAALAALVLPVGAARADLLTFEFTGAVTSAGGSVPVGTPFSGSYTFGSDGVDLFPANPTFGLYFFSGAPFQYSVDIGGNMFSFNEFSIAVVNDLVGFDSYQPFAPITVVNAASSFNVFDPTATAFSSDALPLTPPDLSAFAGNVFFTFALPNFAAIGAISTLTSTLTTVPEPGTLTLFGLGLLGLGVLRRRLV